MREVSLTAMFQVHPGWPAPEQPERQASSGF